MGGMLGGMVLWTLFLGTLVEGQELIVNVTIPDLGVIQGIYALTTRDQEPFWSFHGIPYADPESYIGVNRFQPSKLMDKPLTEDGSPFMANKLFVYCPQNEIFPSTPEDLHNKTIVQDFVKVIQNQRLQKRRRAELLRSYSDEHRRERFLAQPFNAMGQEDCLIVNIDTPAIPSDPQNVTELYPVVVFFHGGGSDSVWGSAFTAERLIEDKVDKVVLITMNYRLGVLGALNLGIDEAPGNAGQYDGILVLEWVQKYIRYFGGDPTRVTISGQSAGAMMVSNLLITPLTNRDPPLFHRVWGFSGTAISVWATAENPSIRHHLDIAGFAGCRDPPDSEDMTAIAKCMREADPNTLVTALDLYTHQEEAIGRLGYDGRMPSIQSPTISHPIFMPKHPYETLEAGEQRNVPVIVGSTRHDGSFPLDDLYVNFVKPQGLDKNETFMKNDLLPTLLTFLGIKDDTGELYHAMGEVYLGNASRTTTLDDKLPGLLDMVTAMAFRAGGYETLRFQNKIGQRNAYFYSMDYKGRFSLHDLLFGVDTFIPGGIAHTDDLIYFFWLGPLLNEDMKVSRRWVKYFINFAYHGDPNGDPNSETYSKFWLPYDDLEHPFLKMDLKDHVVHDAPNQWTGVSLELFADWDFDNNGSTTVTPTTTPDGNDPTTTPDGNDPTTTPDGNDPTTTPDGNDPTTTPDGNDPTTTPPTTTTTFGTPTTQGPVNSAIRFQVSSIPVFVLIAHLLLTFAKFN